MSKLPLTLPTTSIGTSKSNVSPLTQVNEELLFLMCDEKERQNFFQLDVSYNAPALTININISESEESDYNKNFILTCTKYGFQFTDATTSEAVAHNYLNLDLTKHHASLALYLESLRGLVGLAFLNLETYVGHHIDIATMIYSPMMTDYLYKCLDYLNRDMN